MRSRAWPRRPAADSVAVIRPPMFEHDGAAFPTDVLAAWAVAVDGPSEPLASSGFSGSEVHSLSADGRRFVLKSFAAGTARERAAWIHRLVRHLTQAGIDEVPAVVPTATGDTLVTGADGRLWELAHFVAGRPDDAPDPPRAAAALEAVARIHRAAESLPGERARGGEPPAVTRRRSQLATLVEIPWTVRREACRASGRLDDGPMLGRWWTAIAVGASHGMTEACAAGATYPPVGLPLQPVLRDVWSEHVLFDAAGRVAGIVDLHAAAVDTPATDLARLLGSWWHRGAADDAAGAALEAYARLRPLAPGERRLVPWLDAAGVVCGLDHWFRWTLEERRRFADPGAVLRRVDRLLDRLPGALATLWHP